MRLSPPQRLSPLLFILVLEALSREFRTGLPWELLYADDLVIIAESLNALILKLQTWKDKMENKGLRVNMKKTKILVSGAGLDLLEKSGKFPCAVCLKGVGANSILCSVCNLWVHKKCSGIVGRLANNPLYVFPRCLGTARPINGRLVTNIVVNGSELDAENKFYLGDMLSSGGGCNQAIKARCSVAWGKFKKLLPILTSKHIPLTVRGKVFSACVRSAMLHGGETWAPNVLDLQLLQRNNRAMVRWICRVKLIDHVHTDQLLIKLGVRNIIASVLAPSSTEVVWARGSINCDDKPNHYSCGTRHSWSW